MRDKIIAILCMMFGVAALSLEFNRLLHCSRRAQATVVEVSQRIDARGLKVSSPVFEFCVDGRKIRGDGGVPGLPFGTRFQVGDVRQIYYDAANPENFRIRGNCTLLLIGVLFLVSGVYLYLNNT